MVLVLSPDPALKEGKGLVYIEHFLGRSMSRDLHDNTSFWHGNATTLTRWLLHCVTWLSHVNHMA